jgi:hypothetical protein
MKLNNVTRLELTQRLGLYVDDLDIDKVIDIIEDEILIPKDKRCLLEDLATCNGSKNGGCNLAKIPKC